MMPFLRVARRWRVIPSVPVICRQVCHPRGSCKSLLSEAIFVIHNLKTA
uniref:Uncharacterized protein n=1 Tax=Klebsiella pneumoniae TaxID=573 RepID=A0A8B0SWQ5_KLEPN|nr:hypothetical protein [Klebsiella pneumoniae]